MQIKYNTLALRHGEKRPLVHIPLERPKMLQGQLESPLFCYFLLISIA